MRAGLLWLPLVAGCVITREPACAVDADCEWDELCAAETCVSAFDQRYEVVIYDMVLADLHPDGNPWDDDGSPPDPYVVFGVDTETTCATEVEDNAWRVTWDAACDFVFLEDATFIIDVVDADPSEEEDDFGAGWEWVGSSRLAELTRLRGAVGEVRDSTDSVEVTFTTWPLF